MKKPIKVFWSELGQRFYASDRYKIIGDHVVITGEKFDVTNDIGQAMEKYSITFKPIFKDKK